MTDEERQMLQEAHDKVIVLHRALMETNPATGEKPLILRASEAVIFIERGGWMVKWFTRVVISLGALAGALITLGVWKK